ncbi:(2Fe-2S)-binding protein [Streptomyces lydicus]|uniref:(2Fe-2S)-binding protein n=1 Tax=Streptomyces lydicus TaxID=47763 RepID=UPI0037A23B2A
MSPKAQWLRVTCWAHRTGCRHLRDTGTLDPTLPAFARRSCCLYYRVPGGGLCADCVLRRARR